MTMSIIRKNNNTVVRTKTGKSNFMKSCFRTLIVASTIATVAVPHTALAGSLNTVGGWQDGEAGNMLGAVAADALGVPGASERLYSMTHDPSMTVRDTGVPATFEAPVAPPAGYNSGYYYGSSGGGYYMGGGGGAVR
jgi:hypothetical protein